VLHLYADILLTAPSAIYQVIDLSEHGGLQHTLSLLVVRKAALPVCLLCAVPLLLLVSVALLCSAAGSAAWSLAM
jgi:hypothetical protein